jgi:hypothetical protein
VPEPFDKLRTRLSKDASLRFDKLSAHYFQQH